MIDLIDKIGNIMKNLIKYFKRVDGQSLAEFAVTTAMMATLATTAAPKFSGVGEGAKEKKTLADIDKILKSANNFYNSEVTTSGRGRFPGQGKYNETVPFQSGYTYTDQKDAKDAVDAVLDKESGTFNSFDNVGDIQNWVSVFGTNNPDAPLPSDAGSLNNSEDPDETYYQNGIVTPKVGAEEFLDGFGGAPIKSPFQDGHYIYTVIAGSGSGTSSIAPIIYVADLESPRSFNKNLQP
jgi:hypothetical protein